MDAGWGVQTPKAVEVFVEEKTAMFMPAVDAARADGRVLRSICDLVGNHCRPERSAYGTQRTQAPPRREAEVSIFKVQ